MRMAYGSWLMALSTLLGACNSQSDKPAKQFVRGRVDTVGNAPVIAPDAPVEPTTYTDTIAILRRVDSITAFLRAHPGQRKVFAEPRGTKRLSAVTDSASRPEGYDATYTIAYDSAGAVLAHIKVPHSESGDWRVEISHYFDEKGRTIYYRYYASSYTSECTAYLRETIRRFYNPARFRVLEAEASFVDRDRKPVADTARCLLRSRQAGPTARTAAELLLP